MNVVPDSLSRVNEDGVAAIDLRQGLIVDLDSPHFKSQEYLELLDSVKANSTNFPDLKVDSGYVYRKAEHLTGEQIHDEYAWKLWIPKELVPEILFQSHDSPLCSHGETIVSDNGSQFRSEAFEKLLKQYGVKQMFTAVHSPQANASERVNRSVISGIRAYLRPDQKDWDESLSKICCALRSSVHSSIGTSPYYMAFGQHMITSGSTYALLSKLNMLDDRSLVFNRQDSFDLIRKNACKLMQLKHDVNEKRYNLRSKNNNFRAWTRSVPSKFQAKLLPDWL
ncbi:uncharacterized protein LOC127565425 [Drosophila albomicans]|uniref:Uncharacterized protein LOC127565425 n=1 Tax=Drosophila albomicans TaxID=7291 RepID=A0A9C6T496_DROAB|nr:uncharacterized protein LOC127565425 [Drosophila albomicans]